VADRLQEVSFRLQEVSFWFQDTGGVAPRPPGLSFHTPRVSIEKDFCSCLIHQALRNGAVLKGRSKQIKEDNAQTGLEF